MSEATVTQHRSTRDAVAAALSARPVVGVVRTESVEAAEAQARNFMTGGLALVEITFTVPQGDGLVRRLLAERGTTGPPFIGMGTVTTAERARAAIAAGAEFLVSPNTCEEVAVAAREAGLFLVLGALTPSEITQAHALGADLVKVFPVPMVGGPAYLRAVRQPLGDIPMLASGGFAIDEIPAYAAAGAQAFGIGGPLVGTSDDETVARVRRALQLCRE